MRAWLLGKSFFPRSIPCDKDVYDNLANAMESIQLLKAGAKDVRGTGLNRMESKSTPASMAGTYSRKNCFRDTGRFFAIYRKAAGVLGVCFGGRADTGHGILFLKIGSALTRKVLIDSSAEVDGLLQVVDYLCRIRDQASLLVNCRWRWIPSSSSGIAGFSAAIGWTDACLRT